MTDIVRASLGFSQVSMPGTTDVKAGISKYAIGRRER
jgi:hypothetical protein